MTIREYIKGRGLLIRYLSFGWILLPMVPIVIFSERAKTSWIAWLVIGYVMVAAVRYTIAWQTKCRPPSVRRWPVSHYDGHSRRQSRAPTRVLTAA
jgi:predicted membrane channel-forming protein YqfA (hemolysin III family)